MLALAGMEEIGFYLRAVVALFTILTPFAALPIYLALTQGRTTAERARTADRACLTVLAALLGAALGGDLVLALLGTSIDSLRVGGGLVLLLMALSMLNAQVSRVQHVAAERDEAEAKAEVGVVPLGLPLLAGPGALSNVILLAQRSHDWGHQAAVAGVVLAAVGALWVSLRLAEPIGARLGATGLNILNRLFGLLLAAIAVELMARGMRGHFPALGG